MNYSLIELLDFPDGTQFEDSEGNILMVNEFDEGDKQLICTWLYDEDDVLTLSTSWLRERFTKVEQC